MRIDYLSVHNFKGFTDLEFSFHPQFNLVVGDNGTGKTSLLDALSVAAGGWFLGLSGYDTRHIRPSEVRLAVVEQIASATPGQVPAVLTWESQYPCEVKAGGEVVGERINWSRSLIGPNGRTTYRDARQLKDLAARTSEAARSRPVELPLIANYGTGRLWDVPREQAQVHTEEDITDKGQLSRLAGYRNSVDPRLSVAGLVRWIARQSWITYQQRGAEPPAFAAVRSAIVQCIEGAEALFFDASFGEVIIRMAGQGAQPFNNLSDGQRTMLALVGDIAFKAASLNPHLGERALAETPGIVLIDELDLHLHPRWQRHVIDDLRGVFPRLQFICTTHSPFLIQSLRSGEELIVLDGQPPAQLADLPIAQIVEGVQGVPGAEVSERYQAMKQVARNYLETLEEAAQAPDAQLAAYRDRLAESIAPYADNPAFQAFLEMKRAAKLGE